MKLLLSFVVLLFVTSVHASDYPLDEIDNISINQCSSCYHKPNEIAYNLKGDTYVNWFYGYEEGSVFITIKDGRKAHGYIRSTVGNPNEIYVLYSIDGVKKKINLGVMTDGLLQINNDLVYEAKAKITRNNYLIVSLKNSVSFLISVDVEKNK